MAQIFTYPVAVNVTGSTQGWRAPTLEWGRATASLALESGCAGLYVGAGGGYRTTHTNTIPYYDTRKWSITIRLRNNVDNYGRVIAGIVEFQDGRDSNLVRGRILINGQHVHTDSGRVRALNTWKIDVDPDRTYRIYCNGVHLKTGTLNSLPETGNKTFAIIGGKTENRILVGETTVEVGVISVEDAKLTPNETESEDVLVTATIRDHESETNAVRYRVFVNNELYVDWSDFSVQPVQVEEWITFSHDIYVPGTNTIRVEAENEEGERDAKSLTLTILNSPPRIEIIETGLFVEVGIQDEGAVRYRVELNGVKVYPEDEEEDFSGFEQSPVKWSKQFRSSEVNIESENVVTVTAVDEFGAERTETFTFVGFYSGLMFSDIEGEYYSTDFGEILKYLDIGVLVAGQTTEPYPILLTNKTALRLKNIMLFIDNGTLPEGTRVEISKEDSPFEPKTLLIFEDTMFFDTSIMFYARLVSDNDSKLGQGVFDILVRAEPEPYTELDE